MRNDHLSPDLLASIAAAQADEPSHLADCPSCRSELEAMRDLVSQLRLLPDPPARLVEAAKAYFRRRRLLEALIERLVQDPALLAKAAAEPATVLREAGLDPTPELIEVIGNPRRDAGEVARLRAAKSLWL